LIYSALRKLLFSLPPEIAHEFALNALDRLPKALLPTSRDDGQAVTAMGLTFPNVVGIAAGLDKNADHLNGLCRLGCGFVEVGTVTPKAQPGNAKPRLFRLKAERALINRMGFNNKGIEHLLEQVARHRRSSILGINIGKNLSTPIERANDDYLIGLQRAYPVADYITVNISSPNTPGLRKLQLGEQLVSLLQLLQTNRKKLADEHDRQVPVAVKIAPDMSQDEIEQFCDLLIKHEIDGVIATNTTLSRDGVEDSPRSTEAGGLSGAPLTIRSRNTIKHLADRLQGEIPIIGCGGIMCAQDAVDHLQAGATLVQIYSGFIYCGPQLVKEIVDATH
jgi:dihydroorotate dehydrogenase